MCGVCAFLSFSFLGAGYWDMSCLLYINGCSGWCNVTDWQIWHMSYHTGLISCALDMYLRYACLVDDLCAEAAPMALLPYICCCIKNMWTFSLIKHCRLHGCWVFWSWQKHALLMRRTNWKMCVQATCSVRAWLHIRMRLEDVEGRVHSHTRAESPSFVTDAWTALRLRQFILNE
jgi:hypothetical protein